MINSSTLNNNAVVCSYKISKYNKETHRACGKRCQWRLQLFFAFAATALFTIAWRIKLFTPHYKIQSSLGMTRGLITPSPTASPTKYPTAFPTPSPSVTPTTSPSATPSTSPSASPSATPTTRPSASPSVTPTTSPSASPSVTSTTSPSASPSATPTAAPSSSSPSNSPTSSSPSATPSTAPSSSSPSATPTTAPSSSSPSATPSSSPSVTPTTARSLIATPALTWADSETWCVEQGGHLTSIHSLEEHNAIMVFVALRISSSYPWIGGWTDTGHKSSDPNYYAWTDGSPFDYVHSAWSTNDNAPTYMHLYKSSGTWGTNCATCTAEGICSIPPSTSPSAIPTTSPTALRPPIQPYEALVARDSGGAGGGLPNAATDSPDEMFQFSFKGRPYIIRTHAPHVKGVMTERLEFESMGLCTPTPTCPEVWGDDAPSKYIAKQLSTSHPDGLQETYIMDRGCTTYYNDWTPEISLNTFMHNGEARNYQSSLNDFGEHGGMSGGGAGGKWEFWYMCEAKKYSETYSCPNRWPTYELTIRDAICGRSYLQYTSIRDVDSCFEKCIAHASCEAFSITQNSASIAACRIGTKTTGNANGKCIVGAPYPNGFSPHPYGYSSSYYLVDKVVNDPTCTCNSEGFCSPVGGVVGRLPERRRLAISTTSNIVLECTDCVASQLNYHFAFDGDCADGTEIRMYDGDGDNEGTFQERKDACYNACLSKKTPTGPLHFISQDLLWMGFVAQGFIVNAAGRCYCETSHSATCNRNSYSYSYKRYDFVHPFFVFGMGECSQDMEGAHPPFGVIPKLFFTLAELVKVCAAQTSCLAYWEPGPDQGIEAPFYKVYCTKNEGLCAIPDEGGVADFAGGSSQGATSRPYTINLVDSTSHPNPCMKKVNSIS